MNETRPIRALIVEDVEDDAILLVNALKRCGFEPDYHRVDDYAALVAALKNDWDIVFSDHTMPGFDGIDALGIVRAHSNDLPFVFVSGTIGEDRAVDAVKAGAQDYIIKGQFKRLPVAVNNALKEAHIRRENRMAQETINELINVDSLTHLASRSLFLETLVIALSRARSTGTQVAVLLVNVNEFRGINDSTGIKGGDALITELAQRLSAAIDKSSLVARMYADEFAIIVEDSLDAERIQPIVNRLMACFEKPFRINRYNRKVSGRIGYCLYPEDGEDLQELISNATLAQSHAKRGKHGGALHYRKNLRKEYENRARLEREIENGITRNEFQLHYQPQLDLRSGTFLAAEALVRWNHPQLGIVSPMEFIPVAEDTGLILPLGTEICRLACRQAAQWSGNGLSGLRVAINVSAQQFQQEGFAQELLGIIAEHGIDPGQIEVEITETALMSNPDIAFETLTELSRKGVRIALDDFGTGYSSLGYLDRFPIDLLKIDRSFVSELPGDERKAAIVHAIIAIASKLDITVVAEGIETTEQLEFLKASGCDLAQGYFIQRPGDADTILPVLMEQRVEY